ncbi:MAG: response regulator, partial [candidate division Zixibacteria bacterium]|nr:response regulator [candidate division Zixibacteria bacterium]
YVVKPVDVTTLLEKVRRASEKIPGSILVVDDEELLRDLLQRILTRDGVKVLLADSGKQALGLMKTNKVAAVLSDIAMPEMDGFELLAYVKEYDTSIPVILVSGRSEYNREDVITAGADNFITKPFNNVEILDRIRPYLK